MKELIRQLKHSLFRKMRQNKAYLILSKGSHLGVAPHYYMEEDS